MLSARGKSSKIRVANSIPVFSHGLAASPPVDGFIKDFVKIRVHPWLKINQHLNEGENMANTVEREHRNWGMACHLSALICWVGVPFGHIVGPLLIWLIKKEEIPFVDEQGKESLNFEISMSIYFLISLILSFVLIGLPLLLVIPIVQIVLVIIASVKISNGETYRYPFTIRFIA